MDYGIHDTGARVKDYIARELESSEFPGVQYCVFGPDSLIFSYAGGVADVAEGTPVLENTTMMAYSMTKTITAAAILQLCEQEKIALDDPVIKYLSDIPYDSGVTIRHLVAHTSGIPNPIPLRWVHLVKDHPSFDERAALREVLNENDQLDSDPGEEYSYSNIGYWLLGFVVEEATGTGYEDYVRQHIFRQLNIPETEIDFVIPSGDRHAEGYLPEWSFLDLLKSFVIDEEFIGEYEDGWLHINDHYLNGPSYGGIVTSARAIGLFLQDQLRDEPRLFSPETKRLFFERQKNNDGKPIQMTLGWHIGVENGIRYYFKEGGGGGFHSEMRVYPDHLIATVVIANNTSFDAGGFLNAADGEFLKER